MTTVPTITLVARRLACENGKWQVYLDHIRAGATEVPDYLVIAPKAVVDDLITGVTVVPVSEGRIVLLRSYRHAIEREIWEAPRGFVDPGDTPAAAALRELEEETGLTCEAGALRPLGCVANEASTIRGRNALFVAENCRPIGRRDAEEPGLGAVHALTSDEVRAMLARFEIEDAATVAALYAYLHEPPGVRVPA